MDRESLTVHLAGRKRFQIDVVSSLQSNHSQTRSMDFGFYMDKDHTAPTESYLGQEPTHEFKLSLYRGASRNLALRKRKYRLPFMRI
ncbi:hypothetical protein TCAL_15750 [Tigriopus californicus]|uniref:Uncharacterized protein n=1 Tax=Tigriopus californicus TaxID=6832 RepID=A0A553P7M9_TIGCA|nr:hypothetical protein TCAL_15750 [Tigriopus californicus]